jgi:SAM-dependent methyltransferase
MVAAGASVLRSVPNLKERLADYDLIVTSYGLTAFEAARARVPVLLVSPTPYHERLSRARGFVSAGVGRSAAAKVGLLLTMKRGNGNGDTEGRPESGLAFIAERTAAAAPREPTNAGSESAAALLSRFSFPGGGRCPLCGERIAVFQGRGGSALERFIDRTYRRCPSCGILHMVRPDRPPIVYAHDYFFDDYKKQYGRTYLEDFPQLERAGALRVGRIAELLDRGRKGRGGIPTEAGAEESGRRPHVLDIGCAYGPFLAAARSAGFDVFGLDPAEDAVRFVRDELGIPASVGSFPGFDPVAAAGGELFDAVSLWYVIEHFLDLGAALKAASSALRVGGVLAFSTPSGSGISSRARFSNFLEKSPADHWTIWEPGRTAQFLERFGFSLEKIIFTGHHPERFPGLSRSRSDGLPRRLAAAASRAFGLGDTFEAYAVKK